MATIVENAKRAKRIVIKHYPILVFALLGIITVLWFKHGTVVYFHDEVIPLNPAQALNDYFNVWRQSVDFGAASAGALPKLIPIAVFAALNYLGFSIHGIEMLFYFLIVFVAGLGMYLLAQKVQEGMKTQYRAISVVAGLLYVLSPFIFFYLWRLNYIVTRAWFYVFIPLLIMEFISLLRASKNRKNTAKHLALFAIYSVLASPGFSHPAFFLTALLLFLIVYVAIIQKKTLVRSTLYALAAGAIFILTNLYWLLPTSVTFSSALSDAQSSVGLQSVFDDNSANLLLPNNFYLTETAVLHDAAPWYSWLPYYNSIPFLIASIVLFSFAVVSLRTRQRVVLVFFASFLAIWPFMLGSQPPFGEVKSFLFEHISALQVFRDPGKWGFGLTILLSLLVAIGLGAAIQLVKQKALKLAIVAIFTISLGLVSWPFFTGALIPSGYSYPAGQISIPNDYYQAAQILRTNNSRPVMQFPLHGTHNAAKWPGGGYKGVDVLRNISGQPLIDGNSGTRATDVMKKTSQLLSEGAISSSEIKNLMNGLGSSFIVVNKDTDTRYVRAEAGSQGYINTLNKLTAVKLVFDSQNLAIYHLESGAQTIAFTPIIQKQDPFDINSKATADLTRWSLIAPGGSSKQVLPTGKQRDTATIVTKGSFYIKNTESLSVDPVREPFIAIKADAPDSRIAVSAEDTDGNTSWLPDVTDEVVKSKLLAAGTSKNVRFYSLVNFTYPVKTFRVNFVNQTKGQQTVRLNGVYILPDLFNDFALLKGQDANEISYVSPDFALDLDNITRAKLVDYKYLGSSKRELVVTGAGNAVIGLHQAYDMGWKLSPVGASKEPYGNEIIPITIDGFQQGWVVNIDAICEKITCENDKEGKTVRFVASYSPQKLLQDGFTVLLGVLGIALLVLVATSMQRSWFQKMHKGKDNAPPLLDGQNLPHEKQKLQDKSKRVLRL